MASGYSFDKYPKEQLIEVSRRGGLESGAKRRKQRAELDEEKRRLRAEKEIIRELCENIKIAAKEAAKK